MDKPILKIEKTQTYLDKEKHQQKLNVLSDKRAKGKLNFDDIYDQNQIIVEMLQKLTGDK